MPNNITKKGKKLLLEKNRIFSASLRRPAEGDEFYQLTIEGTFEMYHHVVITAAWKDFYPTMRMAYQTRGFFEQALLAGRIPLAKDVEEGLSVRIQVDGTHIDVMGESRVPQRLGLVLKAMQLGRFDPETGVPSRGGYKLSREIVATAYQVALHHKHLGWEYVLTGSPRDGSKAFEVADKLVTEPKPWFISEMKDKEKAAEELKLWKARVRRYKSQGFRQPTTERTRKNRIKRELRRLATLGPVTDKDVARVRREAKYDSIWLVKRYDLVTKRAYGLDLKRKHGIETTVLRYDTDVENKAKLVTWGLRKTTGWVQGYTFMADARGTALFVKGVDGYPDAGIMRVLMAEGLVEVVPKDLHKLTRTGVIGRRTASDIRPMQMALPARPMRDGQPDGTFAIWPYKLCSYAFQATLFLADPSGGRVNGKGMGRPALKNEPYQFNPEGENGATFEPGALVDIYQFNYPKPESTTTNALRELLGRRDPVARLKGVYEKVLKDPFKYLLNDRDRAFTAVGFPIAAFKHSMQNTYDLISKAPLDGAVRTKVWGATYNYKTGERLVGRRVILLGRLQVQELERQGYKLIPGKTELLLARDPSTPSGSSQAVYIYGGMALHEENIPVENAIVIDAGCEAWKAMGGDFDGDSGLVEVLVPGADINFVNLDPKAAGTVRVSRGVIANGWDGDFITARTVRTVRAASQLGQMNNLFLRLLFRDLVTDVERLKAQKIIQGSIDAFKHAIDQGEWDLAVKELRKLLPEDDRWDPVENWGMVKHAREAVAKHAAFKQVVADALAALEQGEYELTDLERCFAEIWVDLGVLDQKIAYLKDLPANMAPSMIDAAEARQAKLNLTNKELENKTRIVSWLRDRWGQIGRAMAKAEKAGNLSAMRDLGALFEETRVYAKYFLLMGDITDDDLIMIAPAVIVRDLCDPDRLQRVALGRSEVVVHFSREIKLGSYQALGLMPFALDRRSQADLDSFGGTVEILSCAKLEGVDVYQSLVHYTPEGQVNAEIFTDRIAELKAAGVL